MKTQNFPFEPSKKQELEKLLSTLDEGGLTWVHGYVEGLIRAGGKGIAIPSVQTVAEKHSISVIYGTHTGNSKKIAGRLHRELENAGHGARLVDIADFKPKDIRAEKIVLMIISTHGEGNPPLAAEEFYEFIHSSRAQALPELKYAILALGDKSYISFCKTGADLDLRFEQLGGKRILHRVDCDVNYTAESNRWIEGIVDSLKEVAKTSPAVSLKGGYDQGQSIYELPGRENPVEAVLLEKVKLSGRHSLKRTYHLEFQLPDEAMIYTPGDSLGIFHENNNELAEEIIQLLHSKAEMPVIFNGSSGSLSHILVNDAELTRLTRENLEQYALLTGQEKLAEILREPPVLAEFIYGCTWADLLRLYPARLQAEDFISMLRPLQPRLYSIASSALANPGEVHLTVSQLRYDYRNADRTGMCSSFLASLPDAGSKVKIFFETNDAFRLPSHDTDIIMIGPGTGVAPFRAFLQEREAAGACGKNWLFFGDWKFTADFLYQTEWQDWHKKSLLNRIDLAFSRDQDEKIYVQHRMMERSGELFDWIENGARIYVCGDMKRMSPDVHRTLIDIVQKEGGISPEKAGEYIKSLRKEKRYLEDVY